MTQLKEKTLVSPKSVKYLFCAYSVSDARDQR